jgi:hypothetical protein
LSVGYSILSKGVGFGYILCTSDLKTGLLEGSHLKSDPLTCLRSKRDQAQALAVALILAASNSRMNGEAGRVAAKDSDSMCRRGPVGDGSRRVWMAS